MEQNLITKLVEFLEKVAPSLWGAAMSRALAQAILTGLAAVVLLTVSVIFFVLSRTYYKKYIAFNKEDDAWISILTFIVGILTTMAGGTQVHDVIMYIAAPELNAIGVLFGLVK